MALSNLRCSKVVGLTCLQLALIAGNRGDEGHQSMPFG